MTRFSEEQIIAILREHEAGVATAGLCHKHGISSTSLYAWKAKYGGMDVADDYNRERPHGKLGWLAPADYAARWVEIEELEEHPEVAHGAL